MVEVGWIQALHAACRKAGGGLCWCPLFSRMLCTVCMWMLAASWIGPWIVPRTVPAHETLFWKSSDFVISFKALSFPRPVKALTMSHPVYVCVPVRALQTPSPSPWRSFVMSRYLTQFFVPHFWNMAQEISADNARQSTSTSVSSAATTTAL